MAWCKGGSCGLFGEGGLIIFDVEGVKSEYGLLELFPVVVLGIIGGVLGSAFNHLNSKIVLFFGAFLNKYVFSLLPDHFAFNQYIPKIWPQHLTPDS